MKITVVAVGTRGDVEPHLALSCGLRDRGHRVRLVAPLDFEAMAAAAGVDFHPIGVSFRGLYDTGDGAVLQTSEQRSLAFIRNLKRVATSVATQVATATRAACADADAVCYSLLGIPAYYFAKERGIPAVATCLQPIGRTAQMPSPLISFGARLPRVLNGGTHRVVEHAFWLLFRPLLKAHIGGPVPFWGHFDNLYRGSEPVLFAYSPSVVARPGDFQPNMHVTGYWMRTQDAGWKPPPALEKFLSTGAPPVCIGFGSMNSARIEQILDTAVQAVRAMGKRALVLTGWWRDRLDRGELGRDLFVIDAVPHAWLFPRVSSVIHHGGAGTTAAALRAGVPSIIVPFFFDQQFWARWLHQSQLGPEPIPFSRLSPERLQAVLKSTEDAALRGRLAAVRARLEAEDGVGNAIAILEQTWHGKR